jgi:uncharacterized metal-binding protein YceD (DUF177 family)
MTTPEFSRPLKLDSLGEAPRTITIEADETERAALARRFDLLTLDQLSAALSCRREGDAIAVEGRLHAHVVQRCVATDEPLSSDIDEPFRLRFVADHPELDEEIELNEEDCDILPYRDGQVDLGEAVAETLVLSIDPFPRASQADEILRAAGVLSEEEAREEANPFAKLRALSRPSQS